MFLQKALPEYSQQFCRARLAEGHLAVEAGRGDYHNGRAEVLATAGARFLEGVAEAPGARDGGELLQLLVEALHKSDGDQIQNWQQLAAHALRTGQVCRIASCFAGCVGQASCPLLTSTYSALSPLSSAALCSALSTL